MKNIIFLFPLLFLLACQTTPSKSEEKLELTQAEKDYDYKMRIFTGPTMQFGRAGNEILALKFHPEGYIYGTAYQNFEQGVPFTDITKAEESYEIKDGGIIADGQYIFTVQYNEKETATFRGIMTDQPLLKAAVSQKAVDGMMPGKTALNLEENVLYNEIIDGKVVINPQYTDGFISPANDYFKLRANIHYPQIIQHPKQAVVEAFNKDIQQKVIERATLWIESQSGDEEAEFYQKRGELKFESNTFDVAHFDKDRLSYIDTISFMNPAMASPRVYLFSYNYDFKANKALQITDILSDNINHKDFLQKKIIEDLPSNPNKDVLKDMMGFELEDFKDWTYDGKTLTLYYLPFGEWDYYGVVRAGIPSIAISVDENRAAFR